MVKGRGERKVVEKGIGVRRVIYRKNVRGRRLGRRGGDLGR